MGSCWELLETLQLSLQNWAAFDSNRRSAFKCSVDPQKEFVAIYGHQITKFDKDREWGHISNGNGSHSIPCAHSCVHCGISTQLAQLFRNRWLKTCKVAIGDDSCYLSRLITSLSTFTSSNHPYVLISPSRSHSFHNLHTYATKRHIHFRFLP